MKTRLGIMKVIGLCITDMEAPHNNHANSFHLVKKIEKIGLVDPEIALLNLKKKETEGIICSPVSKEGYGICGDLLQWIRAFLSTRTQVVNISEFMSKILHITSGVPRGSVLRPTLFLLFINDIEDILFDTSVCMKLFADDVKL